MDLHWFFSQMSQLFQHHLLNVHLCLSDFKCPFIIYWNFHILFLFFWVFYSVSLDYLSTHVPVPQCYNYRGFIACFNVWYHYSPFTGFLFHLYPGYSCMIFKKYINFIIHWSNSIETFAGIFEIILNLYISLGRTDIFLMLCYSIQEHWPMSLYLFKFPSMSFRSV